MALACFLAVVLLPVAVVAGPGHGGNSVKIATSSVIFSQSSRSEFHRGSFGASLGLAQAHKTLAGPLADCMGDRSFKTLTVSNTSRVGHWSASSNVNFASSGCASNGVGGSPSTLGCAFFSAPSRAFQPLLQPLRSTEPLFVMATISSVANVSGANFTVAFRLQVSAAAGAPLVAGLSEGLTVVTTVGLDANLTSLNSTNSSNFTSSPSGETWKQVILPFGTPTDAVLADGNAALVIEVTSGAGASVLDKVVIDEVRLIRGLSSTSSSGALLFTMNQTTILSLANASSTSVVGVLRSLEVGALRFPAGVRAVDGFSWKSSVGSALDRGESFDAEAQTYIPNSFGLAEFFSLCASVGAEPALDVNILETEQDSADLWDYANGNASTVFGDARIAHGIVQPASVVIFFMGSEPSNNYLNSTNYALAAQRYAELAVASASAIYARSHNSSQVRFAFTGNTRTVLSEVGVAKEFPKATVSNSYLYNWNAEAWGSNASALRRFVLSGNMASQVFFAGQYLTPEGIVPASFFDAFLYIYWEAAAASGTLAMRTNQNLQINEIAPLGVRFVARDYSIRVTAELNRTLVPRFNRDFKAGYASGDQLFKFLMDNTQYAFMHDVLSPIFGMMTQGTAAASANTDGYYLRPSGVVFALFSKLKGLAKQASTQTVSWNGCAGCPVPNFETYGEVVLPHGNVPNPFPFPQSELMVSSLDATNKSFYLAVVNRNDKTDDVLWKVSIRSLPAVFLEQWLRIDEFVYTEANISADNEGANTTQVALQTFTSYLKPAVSDPVIIETQAVLKSLSVVQVTAIDAPPVVTSTTTTTTTGVASTASTTVYIGTTGTELSETTATTSTTKQFVSEAFQHVRASVTVAAVCGCFFWLCA